MVEYAEKHNANPAIEYHQADIAQRSSLRHEWKGAFDLLTSFMVLHWVRDQAVALRNVHYLLKPDAEVLLVLMVESHEGIIKIGPTLREWPKWSEYLKVSTWCGVFYSSPYVARRNEIERRKRIILGLKLE